MEMDGDSNEERMLEEGDRGGHGLITGRSVVEVKKNKKRVRMFFVAFYDFLDNHIQRVKEQW